MYTIRSIDVKAVELNKLIKILKKYNVFLDME